MSLEPLQSFFPHKIRLEKLYTASIDGDTSEIFHSKCDNHFPTIVIVKARNGSVFGGYTEKKWNSNSINSYKADKNSFLFNLNLQTKYHINKIYQEKAIFCNKFNGPCFGNGFDLFFGRKFLDGEETFSNFPCAYGESDIEGYELINSGNTRRKDTSYGKFIANELEVYKVCKD